MDVSQVESVAEATSEFADACIPLVDSRDDFGDFSKAVKNAQRFRMKDFADLGDLCERGGRSSAPAGVRDAAKKVRTALFYAEQMLPDALALARVVQRGGPSVTQTDSALI